MNVFQAIEYVEDSEEFKKFKGKNPDYYLVHAFCAINKPEDKKEWLIGYYDKNKDRIVSFTAGEEIKKSEEEEAFKKEGIVEELELKKVKISLEEAIKKAMKAHEKEHKAETITKTIIILQSINKKTIWNITLVTQAFTIINVKVNAETGEETIEKSSVLNLGKRI